MKRCFVLLPVMLLASGMVAMGQGLPVFDAANQGMNIKQSVVQGKQLVQAVSSVKNAADLLATTKKAMDFAEETSQTLREMRDLSRNVTNYRRFRVSDLNSLYESATESADIYFDALNRENNNGRQALRSFLGDRGGYNSVKKLVDDMKPESSVGLPMPIVQQRREKANDIVQSMNNVSTVGYLSMAQYKMKLATRMEESAAEIASALGRSGGIDATPAERLDLQTRNFELLKMASDLRSEANDLLRKSAEPSILDDKGDAHERKKALWDHYSKY